MGERWCASCIFPSGMRPKNTLKGQGGDRLWKRAVMGGGPVPAAWPHTPGGHTLPRAARASRYHPAAAVAAAATASPLAASASRVTMARAEDTSAKNRCAEGMPHVHLRGTGFRSRPVRPAAPCACGPRLDLPRRTRSLSAPRVSLAAYARAPQRGGVLLYGGFLGIARNRLPQLPRGAV